MKRDPQAQLERNAMIVALLKSDATLSYAQIKARIKEKLRLSCSASTIMLQKRKLGMPVKTIASSNKRAAGAAVTLPQKDPLEDDLLRVLSRMRAQKIARIVLTDDGKVHLERQESYSIA